MEELFSLFRAQSVGDGIKNTNIRSSQVIKDLFDKHKQKWGKAAAKLQ